MVVVLAFVLFIFVGAVSVIFLVFIFAAVVSSTTGTVCDVTKIVTVQLNAWDYLVLGYCCELEWVVSAVLV